MPFHDVSRFPIVLFSFSQQISGAEWSDYVARVTEYMHGKQRVVILNDNSLGGFPNATQRAQVAELMKGAVGPQMIVGSCLITKSALVRGAATAMKWISRPAVPMTIVATLDEAYAWAEQMLENAQSSSKLRA